MEPRIPEPAPLLEIKRAGGVWVVEFLAKPGFGLDGFIGLETSSNLSAGVWTRVAWLNDAYPTVEVLAPGVSHSNAPNGELARYSIALPPNADPQGFFRAQAARERHLLDP